MATARKDILVTAAGAAGLAIAAAAVALSPLGLTPDSLHYLDIARSLQSGLGATTYHLNLSSPAVPSPSGLWPPGYPYALAVLGLVTRDQMEAAQLCNAIALVLIGAASWHVCRVATASASNATLAAAVVVAHPAVRLVSGQVLSEGLFVAAVTLALVLLSNGLVRGRPMLLVATGALAGFALTIRYAGLFLVAYTFVVTVVFAALHRMTASATLRALCCVALGPVVASAALVPANLAAFGRPFGMRRADVLSLGEGFLRRSHELYAGIEGLVAGWGTLLLLVAIAIGASGQPEGDASTGEPHRKRRTTVAGVFGGWAVWYCAALFASVVGFDSDPIGPRLLSPVAPAWIIAAGAIAFGAGQPKKCTTLIPATAVALALVGHVGSAVARHRHPGATDLPADLIEAIATRQDPSTLVVASQGWSLRHATGVVVLEDGYPEMERLNPVGVFRFLYGPGRVFKQTTLVFRPGGSMGEGEIGGFSRVAEATRWRELGRQRLPTATIVDLERAPEALAR